MQQMTFNDVVEVLHSMSYEEQQEAKSLLEQYLAEKRRDGYVESYNESLRLEEVGSLTFSSDINELMKLVDED
jgi:predicted DNA-binding WGR domain protein